MNTDIVLLDRDLTSEVVELYASVFAGPPWYEIMKCSACNETYGAGDDLNQFWDGSECRRCGAPLKLVEYWRDGSAKAVYEDALSQKNFVGVGARRAQGNLMAFSWGYAVPSSDTPSVWFNSVHTLLDAHGIDPSETFYAAETGVLPLYQNQGIGSAVMYARFKQAKVKKFTGICFRTINPKLVSVNRRFFGEHGVQSLFPDPDPLKEDRIWYYCSLEHLGVESE
ncbi:hypothetical protein GC175_01790 [bacterium]|nr:hypothetical protein [bacterium]